jgi:16S rRNA (cytosine967-C5)-methyltransferase
MAANPGRRRTPKNKRPKRPSTKADTETDTDTEVAGAAARRVAIEVMTRVERDRAYANILLPDALARSSLSPEDRRFVTQLVYGTTRMKRACDHLVDRFLLGPADDQVRAALRIGAFQLAYLGTPPHAAVGATVGAVTGGGRRVVNAVLRRVSEAPIEFPDMATRLSYPDWVVAALQDYLGPDDAMRSLEAMNTPAVTSTREDGYVQDPASQAVVAAVEAEAGHLVVDLCAAPGGKATGLAATGADVVAGDRRRSRAGLVKANAERLGSSVLPVVADGRHPPLAPGLADRVLVDAPCSGFGSFRRRPDARWRIDPDGPDRLAELQVELVSAGLGLLKPGGVLAYSVCTFGHLEGLDVIAAAVSRYRADGGRVEQLPVPDGPWSDRDGIGVLLPGDSDGMMLARLRVDA